MTTELLTRKLYDKLYNSYGRMTYAAEKGEVHQEAKSRIKAVLDLACKYEGKTVKLPRGTVHKEGVIHFTGQNWCVLYEPGTHREFACYWTGEVVARFLKGLWVLS
jgi:hypothetical protein